MRADRSGSDTNLLQSYAQQLDESQFAEIVRRHIQWVHNLALRQLRDPADAEDATQAVFVLLLRKAPRLNAAPSLAPWLFRSTMFVCRDIRKQRRRRAVYERKGARMRTDQAPANGYDSPLGAELDAAISRLGRSDQQAILLRFFQGLSHGEIAAFLQISEDAAKMRLSRAVQKLRAILTSPANPISAIAMENMLAKNPAAVPADLSQRILAGGNERAGLLARTAGRYCLAAKISLAAAAILVAGTCGGVAIIGAHHLPTHPGIPPVPAAGHIFPPRGPVGVYYIVGPIARPGVWQLLGQPRTIREAIQIAGGIDQPSDPNIFIQLVHRLPNHTEEKFVYRYQSIMQENHDAPGVFPLDRDISAGDTIMVLPTAPFSVPIHTGDLLMIAVANPDQPQETFDLRLKVSPQGNILLPQVGEVNLLGKTMPAAEQIIGAAYAKANVIPSAFVSVAPLER